jgi:3-hydroxyacyl-CoA dehydrogenase
MNINDIKKILIVGAGTMGHGMTQVFATEGYEEVSLFSRTRETLDRAVALYGDKPGYLCTRRTYSQEKC